MMLKRKPILFFTLAFAIVALFGVTEVMAFCDFCNPDPPDLPISVTAGGFTIELVSIAEEAGGCTQYDPDTSLPIGPTAPCYRWNWNIYNEGSPGSLSGLNFLALFIPDCECTDPYVYFDLGDGVGDPDNAKIYPVGAGEPTANLGRYNKSTYIFKLTPNSYLMSFVTTTDVVTTIPMALATGRKNNMTSFEGPGPGCTHPEIPPCEPPAGASAPSQCVVMLNGTEPQNTAGEQWSVSFQADKYGVPIATSVLYHRNLTCAEPNLEPGTIIFDPLQVYSSGGPNQPNVTYTVKIGPSQTDGQLETATAFATQSSGCAAGCYCFDLDCGGYFVPYVFCP
jgi:hypothetical protein